MSGSPGPSYYPSVDNPILKDLGVDYIRQLASLLRLPRDEPISTGWLTEQRNAIRSGDTIPPVLVRRRVRIKWLRRLSRAAAERVYPSLVCRAHGELDAVMLRECCRLVRDECGFRTDVFRAYVEGREALGEGTLPVVVRVKCVIGGLAGLAGLWMSPSDWDGAYGTRSGYPSVWKIPGHTPEMYRLGEIRGACPACILSVIGGRVEALVWLRASLLGRREGEEGRGKGGLLALVEAWAGMFSGWQVTRIQGESEELGRVLCGAGVWFAEWRAG